LQTQWSPYQALHARPLPTLVWHRRGAGPLVCRSSLPVGAPERPKARGLRDLRTRRSERLDLCRVPSGSSQSPHNRAKQGISGAGENAIMQLFLPRIVEVTANLELAGINDERLDDRVASARIP
jgi:hypothetical protein